MIELINTHRKIVLGLSFVVGLIIFRFLLSSPTSNAPTEATTARIPVEKLAEVINFGDWSPSQSRAVLAQIESDNEVTVSSELNGTLESVRVQIGDPVQEGQILATFKLSNDPTQVNFLNAVSNREATEASAERNVKNAEITLRNAQAELTQTISQQDQNSTESVSNLKTQVLSSDTTIGNALNFLDRQLGSTERYRTDVVFGRLQIGATNFVLKNQTEIKVRELVRDFDSLKATITGDTPLQIRQAAQGRMTFTQKVQQQLQKYDSLISDTLISGEFSDQDQNTIQTQVDNLEPTLDNVIVNLNNLIERTESTDEGRNTAIINAQNRIRSAEEQLALAKAQAAAQVNSANTQLSSAQAAQADLIVRAPISGKIVEENVNRGAQMSIGTPLFTIVNDQATKKVVAFLSQEEWEKVQGKDEITIEINGAKVSTAQSLLSARVDPITQKIRTEFILPPEVKVLVGSFVQLLVPLQSENNNLLPISAIAFEPDGPEVLVINAKNITERNKVSVGNIVADSVEILGGLPEGSTVVRYRNRVFSGDLIKSSN